MRLDSGARTTTVPAAGFPMLGFVAAGTDHLLLASPFGTVGWFSRQPGRSLGEKQLLTVMDIDARGDKAALLGADSGSVQGLSRDGVIAWIGSLSKGMSDLKPLMRGGANPGGKDMARCSILEIGAIRFMTDGSVIVVPGAESGVYRYSAAGKLMQTWDTDPLGFVDDCLIPDQELQMLAGDFARRNEWFASRVILDEILPLPSGPALVLRSVEKGATRWDVVTLPLKGGKPERVRLPLTVASPRAHVRGDVRGNSIALLVFDDPLPGQKPVTPPRVVVLSIGGR